MITASLINWPISLPFPAPITLRTPTSLARCSERAVERFMKLIQAISSMIHAMNENNFTYVILPAAHFAIHKIIMQVPVVHRKQETDVIIVIGFGVNVTM